MKTVQPSVHIHKKRDYVPSWARVPQTTVIPYLNGHRGLVGKWRDHMTANVKESDK